MADSVVADGVRGGERFAQIGVLIWSDARAV
jgi:hypothetical protein